MPHLRELPQDIYGVLKGEGHALSPDSPAIKDMSGLIGDHMTKAMTIEPRKPREMGKMWASDIGKPDRQSWYEFRNLSKPRLEGWVKMKFLYGNVVEEITLLLARAAGHRVEEEQRRIELFVGGTDWTVSGKIDAVVDGTLADVKSAASFSFDKYSKEGVTKSNDSFGYRFQLAFYNHFGPDSYRAEPPKFIFIDKSLGHIAVVDVDLPAKDETLIRIDEKIRAIESEVEPPRCYPAVPEGKSGNMKLGTGCSYCDHKKRCWPELRAFAYSNGPVFLTEVKKLPAVPEFTLE